MKEAFAHRKHHSPSCCDLHVKCPARADVFELLVLSWRFCLGRMRNLWEVGLSIRD